MEELLKADVFFFVTTIAVGVFTVFGIVIGLYLIRILREVEYMSRVASEEIDELADDIDEISKDIKDSVENVRKGVEEGIDTTRAYSRVFRRASGIGGIVSLLFNTIMDSRAHKSKRTRRQRHGNVK